MINIIFKQGPTSKAFTCAELELLEGVGSVLEDDTISELVKSRLNIVIALMAMEHGLKFNQSTFALKSELFRKTRGPNVVLAETTKPKANPYKATYVNHSSDTLAQAKRLSTKYAVEIDQKNNLLVDIPNSDRRISFAVWPSVRQSVLYLIERLSLDQDMETISRMLDAYEPGKNYGARILSFANKFILL